MNTQKQKIITTAHTLSDNTTLDDEIYALHIKSKLQRSKEDIKNSRVMTIKESKERMRNRHENFNVK